jgi:hypothetical protein
MIVAVTAARERARDGSSNKLDLTMNASLHFTVVRATAQPRQE